MEEITVVGNKGVFVHLVVYNHIETVYEGNKDYWSIQKIWCKEVVKTGSWQCFHKISEAWGLKSVKHL